MMWFLAVWLGVWLPIAIPMGIWLQWRPFRATSPSVKIVLLMPLYSLAPGVLWGAMRLGYSTWADCGVRSLLHLAISFLGGSAIAIVGLGILLAVQWGLGWQVPTADAPVFCDRPTTLTTIAVVLPLAVWIGGIEELVFRGWVHQQLQTDLPLVAAIAVGSGIFAIAHLLWDGLQGWWQQPGLVVLGGVLVLARLVDGGGLGLPWGLHTGWVFGLAIAGDVFRFTPAAHAPRLWVGRPQQPLTGGLDLGLLTATGLLLVGLWGWG
ncbi:MAG: CPBP family intramembrane metalloprotease [Leptolyngbyaceae cyanobacterium T60_A2020_046]|nr:CPBP family intramembrane metalloprotease [Leptolyngbyaceae cyanobacterium T60_A2020_046]